MNKQVLWSPGKEELQEGDNRVLVQVTAPNGFTKREYLVTVHRRTVEEQQQYEKEQEENQKRLEEIYQTEKTSTLSNEEEKDTSIEKENKGKNWFVIIGIAIVAIVVIFIISKRWIIRHH